MEEVMPTDYAPLFFELMGFERIANVHQAAELIGHVGGWEFEMAADGEVLMHLYLDGVHARYTISDNDPSCGMAL